MSIKSFLHDMKEEIGSISRRGFDVKCAHGFRSRSHRVVQDSLVVASDATWRNCWANMPPELLRDVLMRIEESESNWPLRKHVVACAGVCKSWRDIMKEIVTTPEISGKLTFPISLKQPGPRSSLIQCYIKRSRSGQTFKLFLGLNPVSFDDGKFLLVARKCRHPTCTDYIISLNPDYLSKGSSNYIGKLRSNFLGTKFTIYDSQPPTAGSRMVKCHSTRPIGFKQVVPKVPVGNYPIARLSYELNVLGSRGPRRMNCIIDTIPADAVKAGGEAPTPTEFFNNSTSSFCSIPFFRSKSNRLENLKSETLSGSEEETLVLRNKSPRWHEQLECWCLNFNGRVTVASVKNFQLVASTDIGSTHENVVLQFGKVGNDVFTMDYGYPISAFQAFAICLSSFDTKIACE